MGKSQRLSLDDIRSVFRLLGEVRELGDSPICWRRHAIQGLRALIDADISHAGETPIPCSPSAPEFLGVVIDGVTEPRRLAAYHKLIHERDYSDDPCVDTVARLITGSFTRTRQQLADDRAWYHRRDLDDWRTLGADCFVYTHEFMTERGCIHLISLNREWGRHAFNEHERRIVELFHQELGRMLCEQPAGIPRNLPRRLSQTLDLLMEGASEKEIAAALGISCHTLHGYVKTLYRRFEVSSRPQLLARFTRVRALRPPSLCTSSSDGWNGTSLHRTN